MSKVNIDKIESNPGPKDYFAGKVQTKKIINESITKDVEISLVSFRQGARTKVHFHDSDQVLIAVDGQGIFAVQTKVTLGADGKAQVTFGDKQKLNKGDFACIPAFAWHWHGAQQGRDFSHYQIKRPCKTVWLE